VSEAWGRTGLGDSTLADGRRQRTGLGISASRDCEKASEESQASTETIAEESRARGKNQNRCRVVLTGIGRILGSGLQPPVIGIMVGIVVSLVPALHSLMIATEPGSHAPMGFVYDAIYRVGQAMPPTSMFVLASNLAQGADRSAIPMTTNCGIVMGKMLMLPCIMACVVYALAHTACGTHSGAAWLVALVVSCTPSANKIMVMVEISGQNKSGVTLSILTQYMTAPVLLTAMLTIFSALLQSEWYLPR